MILIYDFKTLDNNLTRLYRDYHRLLSHIEIDTVSNSVLIYYKESKDGPSGMRLTASFMDELCNNDIFPTKVILCN